MDVINEYLDRTRRNEYPWNSIEEVRPRILCADGFRVSVQASEFHYCSPRINGAEEYDTVELGFPSSPDPLIMDYAEDPDEPCGTVYSYAPVHIVCELVEKHGGIVN